MYSMDPLLFGFFGNWNLCFVATEGSPTVIGDIDQDGSVHASDLVLLKRCLLGIMESRGKISGNIFLYCSHER